MRARARRLPQVPSGVRVETVTVDARLGQPYRPFAPHQLLRLSVTIAPPGGPRREVVLEIDERGVTVRDASSTAPPMIVLEIDTLFVVDRQPPTGRFFTWFGVFARRGGRGDQLIVETPDEHVARFIEREIERRLELDDKPVHGELRAFGFGW